MLLLIITLFSNYDLLSCVNYEKAKFDEFLLMKKHHQNYAQIKDFIKEAQHRFHEDRSVLRVGANELETTRDDELLHHSITKWWQDSTSSIDQLGLISSQNFLFPLFRSRPSFPFSITPYTTESNNRHLNWDAIFPAKRTYRPSESGIRIGPNISIPPRNSSLSQTLQPNDKITFSPTIQPPKLYIYSRLFHPNTTFRPNTSLRGHSGHGFEPYTTVITPNDENKKIWLRATTTYTPVERKFETLATQTGMTSSYDYPSAPQLGRTSTKASKAQALVLAKQLKNGSKDQPPRFLRQGLPLSDALTEVVDYWNLTASTASAKTPQFFFKDVGVILDLRTISEKDDNRTKIIDERPATVPNGGEIFVTPTKGRRDFRDTVDVLRIANFNTNEPLTTEHEATRNRNFIDGSITDIMWDRTPGTDQNPITPHYSFLPTQIDYGTYIQSPTGPTPKEPSFPERFLQAIRRNQKITQRKIGNRQLKNIGSRHQPRHQPHQGITVLEIFKRRKPEAKEPSYDPVRRSRHPPLHRISRSQTHSTGTKKRLFPNLLLSNGKRIIGNDTNTDDDDEVENTITQMNAEEGILRLRKISEMTTKLWYSDRTETSTTTPTTQFLRQNTAAHPYFGMIDTLQEGYMMVFLIELTRLIATKEGKAVRDVVKHSDKIIQSLYQNGQLLWFGKPLINITRKVARLLMELEIDVIQDHAANLHQMLSQRHQELSVEVNTILEYADTLYDDDEGTLLFDALKDFAAYPNISLTGYWLCNSLIHNFLRPYRRLKDTQQRLMDSVNLELKSYKKTPLRIDDVRQTDEPRDENHPSPQTEPIAQIEPHWDTTRQRKRKRHHRSHKRKRERKRHRIHRSRPEFSQRHYQKHDLESMTQRTTVQSRFRVKMQKK